LVKFVLLGSGGPAVNRFYILQSLEHFEISPEDDSFLPVFIGLVQTSTFLVLLSELLFPVIRLLPIDFRQILE